MNQSWLTELVLRGGGEIEDGIFVVRPGCIVLMETALNAEATDLFKRFNIDTACADYEQFAEFSARLTYLSFNDQPTPSASFNERIARKLEHLSVYSAASVTFLIAGIAVETSLELVSHTEARVARLTTSNTKAMNHCLFRIQGEAEERMWQKELILNLIAHRTMFERTHPVRGSRQSNEWFNTHNAGSKATALVYTMNLKDYHKLFIGRLPESGNEAEVREICSIMCSILNARYPMIIRPPDEYAGLSNGQKYTVR